VQQTVNQIRAQWVDKGFNDACQVTLNSFFVVAPGILEVAVTDSIQLASDTRIQCVAFGDEMLRQLVIYG
jgi:hypothetical protein